MAKDSVAEYDTTPANNTDVGSISITGASIPSNFDNAFSQLMSHLRDEYDSKTTELLGIRATTRFNLVINPNFTVNQRSAGTKAQSVGVYGYDCWKGHADGLEQVVEDVEAGEYTLTWTGGGNGTFGGTTSTSPIKATVTAGDQSVIVPSTSTKISLLKGDATGESDPFIARTDPLEFSLCQMYYAKNAGSADRSQAQGYTLNNTSNLNSLVFFKVRMAGTPSVSLTGASNGGTFGTTTGTVSATSEGFTEQRTATGGGMGFFSSNWVAKVEL